MFSFTKVPNDTIEMIKENMCITERIKPWNISSYPDNHEYIKTPFEHLMYYSFFYPSFTKSNNKRKLYEILNNTFYSEQIRNHIETIFYKIKRIDQILNRFVRNYKWKKSKTFDNNVDLCMNDLALYRAHTLIVIMEDCVKYTFRLSDIMKIIHNALTHHYEMFADPQTIKNPYTNKPISEHNLYNIYYSIKYSNYTMPILFHLFYIIGFNDKKFILDNEVFIREETIMSVYKNLSKSSLTNHIRDMFDKYKRSYTLKVDVDFPTDKLNEIFYPFIESYLFVKYSLIRYKTLYHRDLLTKKLIQFCKQSPKFGRKIIRMKPKKKDISFITEHVAYAKLIVHSQDSTTYPYDSNDSDTSDTDSDDELEVQINEVDDQTDELNEQMDELNEQIEDMNELNGQMDELNEQFGEMDLNNDQDDQMSISVSDDVASLNDQMSISVSDDVASLNDQMVVGELVLDDQNSGLRYHNVLNPLTLYNFNGEENTENNCDSDSDSSSIEEESRTFPYNYDSH